VILARRRRSARELVPIDTIAADALRLRGGGLRAVLECATLAFGIKGEAEQRAVIDGWASLLSSLPHSLQVLIRSRRVDPHSLAPLPAAADGPGAGLRDSYTRLVDELAGQRRIVDRRFFVVVPWEPASLRRTRVPSDGLAVLEQRVRWIAECLRRLDLEPRRLANHELAELLRRSLDTATGLQPIATDDTLGDAADLVAPAAVAESPGSLAIGERLARALVVVRYPARLQPGWLGELQSFEADLDIALHLAPSAGPATMAFLERRIAELSSTLRVSEEHGSRTDPYRRVALSDALELRDRLAQGSERLFDTTLCFTVWASNPDELDTMTRGLEAHLGTRLVHTRRLLFQMRPGLVTALPLGRNELGTRRVLSTTALAASFPFTGSDLRARSGLLYGINAATRSPVVLDRFALENHNAVVFATSGAGKSYLVKIELARAQLAGTRTVVIDPEGEYAPLLSTLGSNVVAVRPGASTGLDPFALTDATPGALSVRIATLTTLVDLLVGGLRPRERTSVEEAISFAFVQAGFVDGGPTVGLVAPQLGDVHARLRVRPEMEEIAHRLMRYVSGPGSWLFQRGDALPSMGANSVVYVLAGLPEEERAAAMFLVLDRIWGSLANSTRPTFVVVDEAWWLMRHPDTAAFLFRLVKTARKRRAGLTLVTQDIGDVLSSPDGEALITNSALQILMKQAPQAMPRLGELFRLTRAEHSYLVNAQQGEGLLIAQGRRVPLQVVATDEEARLIEGRADVR
jgi:conjugal transfer ATP-binding protein TraC